MIRLHRIPYRQPVAGGPIPEPIPFLVAPDKIVLLEPFKGDADSYVGGLTVVSTQHPACEGVVVRESIDQIAMLISGWRLEQRLKNTSLSTELPLFTYLNDDGAFAIVEKALAR